MAEGGGGAVVGSVTEGVTGDFFFSCSLLFFFFG